MSVLKAALLGRSLTHSISPSIHSKLFELLQPRLRSRYAAIDYIKVECEREEDFRNWVSAAAREGFRGANITFPYKELASTLGEDGSSVASKIHSANTLTFNGSTQSNSTDGKGFLQALRKEYPNLDPADYHLFILGAGGAARAVVHALHSMHWRKISVAARSIENAQHSMVSYSKLEFYSLNELRRTTGNYFVINATPVGQMGEENVLKGFGWQRGDVAADLVYNPLRTSFLRSAETAGARTVDGLGMLIEQAALSQHIWITGEEARESPLTMHDYQLLRSQFIPLLSTF